MQLSAGAVIDTGAGWMRLDKIIPRDRLRSHPIACMWFNDERETSEFDRTGRQKWRCSYPSTYVIGAAGRNSRPYCTLHAHMIMHNTARLQKRAAQRREKRMAEQEEYRREREARRLSGNPRMICLRCGKPLTGRQERFCSKSCSGAEKHRLWRERNPEKYRASYLEQYRRRKARRMAAAGKAAPDR